MLNPNPFVSAALPGLIAVVTALEAFDNAMGPDPAKWGLNFPGAKLILTGTVLQQLPVLATAEGGAAIAGLNGVYAGWITKLQAMQTPPPAAPASV